MHHIQDTYDQMVFEEWEFESYYRCPGAALTPFSDLFAPQGQGQPECAVIVDSGFSFTHVTPVLQSSSEPIFPASIQWPSVRRLDVGGKLLTNHLKELVSFRHWDMTESTHIINQVKERCCFVSRNFAKDLELCRSDLKSNPVAQSYVLPSFASEPPRPGYVRSPSSPPLEESDTVLPMNNERFVIPELLFQPSDVGLAQVGLVETIANSIESLPEEMRGVAWANIGLVGGNCLFAGFQQRLFDGLRALAPSDYEVCLYRAKNPITSTYHAAHNFANSSVFPSFCVTRSEYLERGLSACRRKFANVNWYPTGDSDGTTEKRDAGAGRKDRKASLLGRELGRRKSKSEAMAITGGEGTASETPGVSAASKRSRKSAAAQV
ncbi:actin [Ceratobasidium sp. AG-Ba]|nr:actin [Ceratobasidium sp. AG-Ba]